MHYQKMSKSFQVEKGEREGRWGCDEEGKRNRGMGA
jgi:hypothetical protein